MEQDPTANVSLAIAEQHLEHTPLGFCHGPALRSDLASKSPRASLVPEPHLRPLPGGKTQVALLLQDTAVSRMTIVPFTLQVGVAQIRMDGIAEVWTDEAYRNRGYARQMLLAGLRHMRGGDAGLSQLYGIKDFYHRFGFENAGPDHLVKLTERGTLQLPPGWRSRGLEPQDLPRIVALYDGQLSSNVVGAAVRTPDAAAWTTLEQLLDGPGGGNVCRIVIGPDEQVHGYARTAEGFWYQKYLKKRYPDAFVIGETIASSPLAAEALLRVCRNWAEERNSIAPESNTYALLSTRPDSHVGSAALLHDAVHMRVSSAASASMAGLVDPVRLLRQLAPELSRRVGRLSLSAPVTMTITTELGAVNLKLSERVSVIDARTAETCTRIPADGAGSEHLEVDLPQGDLARLTLGACPPRVVFARTMRPISGRAAEVLSALFPENSPHLEIPDRF